jgi:hypothetical protein
MVDVGITGVGAAGAVAVAWGVAPTVSIAEPWAVVPPAEAETVFRTIVPTAAELLTCDRTKTLELRLAAIWSEQVSCSPATLQVPPVTSVTPNGCTATGKLSRSATSRFVAEDVSTRI